MAIKNKLFLLGLATLLSCTSGSEQTTDGDDEAGGAGGAEADGGSGGGGKGGKAGAGGKAGSGGKVGSGGNAGGAAGGAAGSQASGGMGGALAGQGGTMAEPVCEPILEATVRDFNDRHPDFEPVQEQACPPMMHCWGEALAMVKPVLGPNKKPELSTPGAFLDNAGYRQVTSPQSFSQWFQDISGVNMKTTHSFVTAPRSRTLYGFGSEEFFPIDNALLGNTDLVERPSDDAAITMGDAAHNQLMTVELHADFVYQGGKGEIVIAESDDDLWLFINGKLAIDNGGLHPNTVGSVNLDTVAATLGLEVGKIYAFDLFYADRKLPGAVLRVGTNLKFTKCKP